jgi:hypothetical protein
LRSFDKLRVKLVAGCGKAQKTQGEINHKSVRLGSTVLKGSRKAGFLTIKRNGVVLLRNDPAIFNRTGEFSVKPILKIFESGGFCLLLCFILGYEDPAQYHFLK